MKPQSWLWPLSIPYGVAVGVRNRLFNLGVKAVHKVDAPVISVGNISAGGTGKTPFVLTLIDQINAISPRKKQRIAVVSRGYGRSGKGFDIVSDGKRLLGDPFSSGDEPYMIAEESRNTIVIVDADRVRGANAAIEMFKANVILLDDGFQHRRLVRDLDIVLLDGRNPLGNKLLLPAGFLREPISSLARADLVVLSKSIGDDEELTERSRKMSELIQKPVLATRLKSNYWRRAGRGEVEAADQIAGKRVVAFAGIASPHSFFEEVERLGGELVTEIPLPDHCNYGKFYLDKIARIFVSKRAEWLVTTPKDAVKLSPVLKMLPVYSLSTSHELVVGRDVLQESLRRVMSRERLN